MQVRLLSVRGSGRSVVRDALSTGSRQLRRNAGLVPCGQRTGVCFAAKPLLTPPPLAAGAHLRNSWQGDFVSAPGRLGIGAPRSPPMRLMLVQLRPQRGQRVASKPFRVQMQTSIGPMVGWRCAIGDLARSWFHTLEHVGGGRLCALDHPSGGIRRSRITRQERWGRIC